MSTAKNTENKNEKTEKEGHILDSVVGAMKGILPNEVDRACFRGGFYSGLGLIFSVMITGTAAHVTKTAYQSGKAWKARRSSEASSQH